MNVQTIKKTSRKKKKAPGFLPSFNVIWNKNLERMGSSTILIKGSLLTCIILSIASGFIDLAFFSGISTSLFHIATIPMWAAVLYTIISIGFISGKFWCAMKIGMIKELRTRLEAYGVPWANELKKALIPWHIAHKFLISVSILTALALSVNSIGSAMKDAERNTTNITISIDELKALKDQKKSDSSDKRSLTRNNLEGTAKSKETAEKEADRYWPNIEKWQTTLSSIYENEEYLALTTEEEKTAYIESKRKPFKKMAPTFIGNNIDYISKSELVTKFQQEAKKTEVDKESIAAYDALTNENNEEIKNTIIALNNLYKHPDTIDGTIRIKGKPVEFVDENGELMDITQVIGTLQGLREEWKTNSDIGESSQIFMLVSELITSKMGKESSGAGIAATLMMIFIALIGIVQEFLIAIFTPKAAIDRKLLSQVSQYLKWKDAEEKERFLISVYIDYLGDGVINQEQFNFKCQKSVEQLGKSVDDYINLFKDTETLEKPTNDIWKSEFEKINKKLAELEKREPGVKEVIKEVPVEKIKEVIKEVPVVKEVPKIERKIIEKGLSDKVDQKAAELDELIKGI